MSRSDSTYPSDRPFVDSDGVTHLRGNTEQVTIGTGASITVTAAQSGTVFVSDTVDAVYQLPSTAAGLTYTFVAGVLSATTGLSVSPAAADKILTAAKADNADYVNTAATDVVGDSVTVVGDGVNGWLVVAKTGTWA